MIRADRAAPGDAAVLRAAAIILLRIGPSGRLDRRAWVRSIRRLNRTAADIRQREDT